MARKAVQGYTEKSYYDNTRFLGMIATNDPLNEGAFKHLVNFNISDTAQSVKPRDGYITTTLTHADEEISLSTRTILFRDHYEQVFVVFDFDTPGIGYLVDLSTYRLDKYLLPVNEVIGNIDATSLVFYLNKQLNINQNAVYYFTHTVFTEQSELRMIYDEFGVRKYIIQLTIKDSENDLDYPFIFEVFYNHTDDILVCGATPTNEHPSYSVKNIASKQIFLPPNFQRVYTDSTRPVGHVNLLGATYVRELIPTGSAPEQKYYNTFVFPNAPLQFIPYFELNPAALTNNDNDAKWAYRFEIASTEPHSVADALQKDYVYRSKWYDTADQSSVFTYDKNIVTTSFTIPEGDRHYKETDYIFTIFTKFNDKLIVSNGSTNVPPPANFTQGDLSAARDRANFVRDKIQSIKDKASFIKAFEGLKTSQDTYRVHVYRWGTANSINTPEFENLFGYSNEGNVEGTNGGGRRIAIKHASGGSDVTSFMEVTPNEVEDYAYTIDELLEEVNKGSFISFNITYKIMTTRVRINHSYTGGFVDETRLYSLRAFRSELPSDPVYDDFSISASSLGTSDFDENPNAFLQYNRYEALGNDYTFYSPDILQRDNGSMPGVVFDTAAFKAAQENQENFLEDALFFKNGYLITFYLRPYTPGDVSITRRERELTAEGTWLNTSLVTVRQVSYGFDNLTVTNFPILPQLDDANAIQESKNMLIFKEELLVIWENNTVYLSDRNSYYIFRDINKKSYSERIVKVIEYKNILLVFTVQHLYALYETTFKTGTGEAAVETTFWTTQRVLYNILTDPQYADVIQVFNEMILFYSSDGQMFLIKPNTMIDNETRFTLKYFNKAVNDVLLNYDVYMRERMRYYDVSTEFNRDDIVIKSLVSVNFIKIMYSLPNVMTYILIYDVLNNRYYAYDTLTFHTIKDTMYVDSGDMYITHDLSRTLFTFPYKEMYTSEQVVDMTCTKFFQKEPIYTLIDTGNMNLNNHLMKRFRDLHVIFKNINASNVSMNIETVLDDIVATPYYDTQLEVKEVDGTSYFVQVANLISSNIISELATNTLQYALDQGLFENQNLLMDFSDYSATKLLTHRSTIVGMGKSFRLKLQFVSKGDYKIQAFGIIYKERRV